MVGLSSGRCYAAPIFLCTQTTTMKRLIIISMLLAACSKPSTPTPPSTTTPPAAGAVAKFIPNWYSNDTLYGSILDANNNWTGDYDTMFTKTVNDTSFIIYKGKQYYIFEEPITSTDTFKNNESTYVNIRISPDKTEANSITKSAMNGAMPHKYIDGKGNWSYQRQGVLVNDYKNFAKVSAGLYQARYQKK